MILEMIYKNWNICKKEVLVEKDKERKKISVHKKKFPETLEVIV